MRLANLHHDLLLSSAAMTFFIFSMYDETRRNVVFEPIKEKKKGREKNKRKTVFAETWWTFHCRGINEMIRNHLILTRIL